MVDAAANTPPFRASILPSGLKRAIDAIPVYAVFAPCESRTTLLMGEAEGVASNSAVNVTVWLANERFCQLPPDVAVAHPGCWGPVFANGDRPSPAQLKSIVQTDPACCC